MSNISRGGASRTKLRGSYHWWQARAIIGSQMGGSKGRIATGFKDAVIGTIVGDRIDNNNPGAAPHQVESCTQVNNYQQIVRDYDVTYQYQNRIYQTIMQN